jgi:hypothetical protein
MAETTIMLPRTLSEALQEVDFGDHASGAQRVVLWSRDGDWVLKIGYAQANANEVAWSERSADVAYTRPVEQDVDLDETYDGLTFVAQEACDLVGEADVCGCGECEGDIDFEDFDMCSCDLHEGNLGWSPTADRWVAIDAGCCHPRSYESGGFDHNGYWAQEVVQDLEAYASVYGG